MRKFTIALLVALLAVTAAMPVDAAQKKKKKKKKAAPVAVTVDYFLRADEGCTEPAHRQLMLSSSDDGSNCGSFDMGPPNAVALATGGEPAVRDYTATEGVPLVLNAAEQLTGMVAVSSWAASAGPTTFVLNLVATIDGEEHVIAEYEESYTAVANGVHETEIAADIVPDFDGKTVEALRLELYNHGIAPAHGYYRSHTPNSFITVPTWQTP